MCLSMFTSFRFFIDCYFSSAYCPFTASLKPDLCLTGKHAPFCSSILMETSISSQFLYCLLYTIYLFPTSGLEYLERVDIWLHTGAHFWCCGTRSWQDFNNNKQDAFCAEHTFLMLNKPVALIGSWPCEQDLSIWLLTRLPGWHGQAYCMYRAALAGSFPKWELPGM